MVARTAYHGFARVNTDPASPLAPLHSARTTRAIIGLFFTVYNELGPGFLESVYRNALSMALDQHGIKNVREAPLDVYFRGARVGAFRVDLLVDDCVLVEAKVVPRLDHSHAGQLLNYLRACHIEVGLLLNFGSRPAFKRLIYTNDRKGSIQGS